MWVCVEGVSEVSVVLWVCGCWCRCGESVCTCVDMEEEEDVDEVPLRCRYNHESVCEYAGKRCRRDVGIITRVCASMQERGAMEAPV